MKSQKGTEMKHFEYAISVITMYILYKKIYLNFQTVREG